jgi:hypothetical protein
MLTGEAVVDKLVVAPTVYVPVPCPIPAGPNPRPVFTPDFVWRTTTSDKIVIGDGCVPLFVGWPTDATTTVIAPNWTWLGNARADGLGTIVHPSMPGCGSALGLT